MSKSIVVEKLQFEVRRYRKDRFGAWLCTGVEHLPFRSIHCWPNFHPGGENGASRPKQSESGHNG